MTTRIKGLIPRRQQKVRRFTPWLELRVDRLIFSCKRPLFAGGYEQKTGDGYASASTGRHRLSYWRRDIRRGQWAGPRRLTSLEDVDYLAEEPRHDPV